MSKDNGGPAFPYPSSRSMHQIHGMTLRDYFAAKALVGLAGYIDREEPTTHANVALHCYKMADAMLAERVK
jgi:hypothetical protein